LNKGAVVRINGAQGQRPTIALAQGNSGASADGVIGILLATLANNASGLVCTAGLAKRLDTSAYTEGVKLFLSPSVAGGLTPTRPSAPDHAVAVGIVSHSSATTGSIEVNVVVGDHLEWLHDVSIGTLANNDLLAYESSTDLWKNKTFSALGLLTTADAATTYAPIASPTFTGTVTIPAGASISGFAPLASPTFTGTPSLPTGTTAVTQTAGNNTTALATTAFVTAAVPALATDAQARQGISQTVASNPYDVITAMMVPGYRPNLVFLSTTSGSGSQVGTAASAYVQMVGPNVSTAGHSIAYTSQFLGLCSGQAESVVRFNRPIRMSGSVNNLTSTWIGDANSEYKTWLGNSPSGSIPSTSYADPTSPAIGWKKAGGVASVFRLMVHNGTTLTLVNTTVTMTTGIVVDWEITSDGAGNVQLFLNGTLAASTTAGPSGVQANICSVYHAVGQTALAATRIAMNATYTKLWVAPQN
jgi:hypothetical protein